MKMIQILATAAFALASSVASAATIWAPTNVDTDFIQFEIPGVGPGPGQQGITTNGGTLALFDDDDFGGTALVIGEDGGHVVFSDNMNGSWNAEVFFVNGSSGGSITLSSNPFFKLGIDWGAGYVGDSNFSLLSAPDAYLIVFDGFDASGKRMSGSTLAVDLAPIPVPAAAWLFASGLLGLVAVVRRRA